MCGRYSQTVSIEKLKERFRAKSPKLPLKPRYNLAPSQNAPIVVRPKDGSGENLMVMMKWGLVPSWAKDPAIGHKMINARAETVAAKPSFRHAFRRKRCLVPADGFYEWRRLEGKKGKVPMRIQLKTGEPFAFAGLWERWEKGEGAALDTFTIITTMANALLKPVHDRMPVIVPPQTEEAWLDPDCDNPTKLGELLRPYDSDLMQIHEVSKLVNSPANDTEECIRKVDGSL